LDSSVDTPHASAKWHNFLADRRCRYGRTSAQSSGRRTYLAYKRILLFLGLPRNQRSSLAVPVEAAHSCWGTEWPLGDLVVKHLLELRTVANLCAPVSGYTGYRRRMDRYKWLGPASASPWHPPRIFRIETSRRGCASHKSQHSYQHNTTN
jgi:hypothetical protein